jgi:hypothetical protein
MGWWPCPDCCSAGVECFCMNISISGVDLGTSNCTAPKWVLNRSDHKLTKDTPANVSSFTNIPSQTWATDAWYLNIPTGQDQGSFGNCFETQNPMETPSITNMSIAVFTCFDAGSGSYGRAEVWMGHGSNGTWQVFEDLGLDIFTCDPDLFNATWTYSSSKSIVPSKSVINAQNATVTITQNLQTSGICYPRPECFECDNFNLIADQVTFTISGATDDPGCGTPPQHSYMNGTWVLDRCTTNDTCQWIYTEPTGLSFDGTCCGGSQIARTQLSIQFRQWWDTFGGGLDGDSWLLLTMKISPISTCQTCECYDVGDITSTASCEIYEYERFQGRYDNRWACDSFSYVLTPLSPNGIPGVSTITISSV